VSARARDCHGLRWRSRFEQQLGFTPGRHRSRRPIAEFNAAVRKSRLSLRRRRNRLTERIGYCGLDLDDPTHARTTSTRRRRCGGALKQLWDKELLYEGNKVVPYCARDGTALSSHEVAQGYKDVEDPSVFVRLQVTEAMRPCSPATSC
jgi:isoleucyl-tRNA synthetase